MDNIIAKCQEAQQTVDAYYNVAKEQVSKLVLVDGKVSKELLNQEQHAAHGLAWIATYKETLREMLSWACLLYTSPSPRDRTRSRMPSSA